MFSILKGTKPTIVSTIVGRFDLIISWLTVLVITGLSALIVSRYLANRFHANRKKTEWGMTALTMLIALLLLFRFGCTQIAVKGIILSLVFLTASFEDIKTRECDDFLHVMIVIAGFIGVNLSALPGMILSAIIIFALLMGTVLISNGKIGGADIKMSVACAFSFGLTKGLSGLMFGLLLAVVLNLLRPKKECFPMIPYLALGFMSVYFI